MTDAASSPDALADQPGTTQGYARVAAVTAIVNMAMAGAGLLAPVIVARQFGAEGRGELAAILTIPVLVSAVANLGLPGAASYFVAVEPEQGWSIVKRASRIAALSGLAGTAVAVLLLLWFLDDQTEQVQTAGRIAAISVLLLPILGTLAHPLRSIDRYRAWNIARASFELALLFAVLAALAFGLRSMVALSWLYVAPFLPAGVICVLAWRGASRQPTALPRRSLVRFGVPAMLATLPYYLNYRVDQLVLLRATDTETLGYYATAVTWSAATLGIVNAFAHIAMPRIIQAGADGTAAAAHHIRLTIATAALFGIPAAMLAPIAVPLIFGAEFVEAVPYAIVLSLVTPLLGVATTLEEVLRAQRDLRYPAIAQTAGLAINVVALLVLVPIWGAWGAATASAGSYLLVVGVLLLRLHRLTGLPFTSFFPRWTEFRAAVSAVRRPKRSV